jgi:hypothetical protein
MATGASTAATMARGEHLERYLGWQQRWSPSPPPVRVVDAFPTEGHTDDLAIEGDCDALYLNIGDQYEPWITVVERDHVLRLDRVRALRPGTVRLLTVTGAERSGLDLVVDEDQRVRFVLWDEDGRAYGDWIELGPTTTGDLTVGVRHDTASGAYLLDSIPGGPIGSLPSRYLDENVDTRPTTLEVKAAADRMSRLGLDLTLARGPVDPLCRAVAEGAGVALSDR